MKIVYDSVKKIVTGEDDSYALTADDRLVTHDEIPDLIANGATVDPSANDVGNDAPVAPAPAVSATSSVTEGDSVPAGGLGNVPSSTTGTASASDSSLSSTPATITPVPTSTESSQASTNNPTTDATVVPTTSTPVTDVPSASSPAPSEVSPSDSSSAGSAAPVSADVPVSVSTVETKTYADGAVATGTNPPDVSPLDNTSPVVHTQPGAGNPIVVGASSAATESDPLHVRIASHLEAIYQLAKDTAPVTNVATPEGIAEIKDHANDVLHRVRNGIAVTEGEVIAKLQKLVTLLELL